MQLGREISGRDGRSARSPTRRAREQPWWRWTIGALVVLALAVAILRNGDERQTATTKSTMTFPPRPSEAARPSDAVTITFADAREAVDEGRYADATTMATGLGTAAQKRIERRIADNIARRALSAVRDGRRRRASELLARAASYPATELTGQATASFRAAQARAAARAEARSAAAAEQAAADTDREARPAQDRQPPADAQPQPDGQPEPAEPAWSSGGAAPRPLTP